MQSSAAVSRVCWAGRYLCAVFDSAPASARWAKRTLCWILQNVFGLQALENCTNPATQKTELCALVEQFQKLSAAAALSQYDQLSLVSFDPSTLDNWEDFLVQSILAKVDFSALKVAFETII